MAKGAHIDAKDSASHTPIWHAITAGNEARVQVLIQSGASTTAGHPDGVDLLWLAIQFGKTAIVKLLVEAGLKVTIELICMINSSDWKHTCTAKTGSPCMMNILYYQGGLDKVRDCWKSLVLQKTTLVDSLSYFNGKTSLKECSRRAIYTQLMKSRRGWNSLHYEYVNAVNSLRLPEILKKYLLNEYPQEFKSDYHYDDYRLTHDVQDLMI